MFRYLCCPGSNELMSMLGSPKRTKDSWYSREPSWGLRKDWLFVAAGSASSSSQSTKPRPNRWATFPTQTHRQNISAISKEKRVINITTHHTANTTCFKNVISKFPSESGVRRKWSHLIYLTFRTYCKWQDSLISTSSSWLLENSRLLQYFFPYASFNTSFLPFIAY